MGVDHAAYEELQKALEAKLGEKITLVPLTLPLTERNQLLQTMVSEIARMFTISKEFGLDANLSTNIRHGFIMREIRGPFVAHHLVTNKTSESGIYQDNEYWLGRVDLSGGEIVKLNAALARLSEGVDQQIDHLNSQLLRIRTEQAPQGLFDFGINEVAFQILQFSLESLETYEEFFDAVIDFLWAVTNRGLELVRRVLTTFTLKTLQTTIDQFQDSIADISRPDELNSLLAASNLARTDLGPAVERVASWFTLSHNTEYQDYQLQISYEAGLATVRSYYAHLDIRSEITTTPSILMAGKTLPSFARLFSMLVDNAAFHSKIESETLLLKCECRYEDGVLYIAVTNNLSPKVDKNQLRERIQRINSEFGAEPASEVISREGGSGYPKILENSCS